MTNNICKIYRKNKEGPEEGLMRPVKKGLHG